MIDIRARLTGLTRSDEFRALMIEIEQEISDQKKKLEDLRTRLKSAALDTGDAGLKPLRDEIRQKDDQLENLLNALDGIRAKETEAAAAESEAQRSRRKREAKTELAVTAEGWRMCAARLAECLSLVSGMKEHYESLTRARRDLNIRYPNHTMEVWHLESELKRFHKEALQRGDSIDRFVGGAAGNDMSPDADQNGTAWR